jgi:hypothetical protein
MQQLDDLASQARGRLEATVSAVSAPTAQVLALADDKQYMKPSALADDLFGELDINSAFAHEFRDAGLFSIQYTELFQQQPCGN